MFLGGRSGKAFDSQIHSIVIEMETKANEQLVIEEFHKEYDIPKSEMRFISPEEALKLYIEENDPVVMPEGVNPFLPIVLIHEFSQPIDQVSAFGKSIPGVIDIISGPTKGPTNYQSTRQYPAWSIAVLSIYMILTCYVVFLFTQLVLQSHENDIEVMILSGAYDHQVMKPYLILAIKNALLSSVIALIFMFLTITLLPVVKSIFYSVNAITIASSILLIIIVGIVIYVIITYIILKLYLNKNT